MIFEEQPENFNSRFEVVSIFCEHDGRFILLHRQGYKPQGNTWGVPAGKVDLGENIQEAILRELREETGMLLDKKQLKYFRKIYVKYPEYDFIYHIFYSKLPEKYEVVVREDEHKDFIFATPEEAFNMPLIQDLNECIKLFYSKDM